MEPFLFFALIVPFGFAQVGLSEVLLILQQLQSHRQNGLEGLFGVQRWEIETTYHELKVDQGMDRHLRGRTPSTIRYEVAGHVVLYLLTRWLMVEAALKHGLDPLRLSFLQAQRELDAMRPALVTATARWAAQVLIPRLLDRIAQHLVPSRPPLNPSTPQPLNSSTPQHLNPQHLNPSARPIW